ncbi:transposase [Rhizobium laguerreae]|nr:transposase [Rhizobium laguerreae]
MTPMPSEVWSSGAIAGQTPLPRPIADRSFSFSRWVYRQRNIVERFFNRIKNMRGIATRYDRRADNYLAALKIVAARMWIASNYAAS